jgi:hypothetical protein
MPDSRSSVLRAALARTVLLVLALAVCFYVLGVLLAGGVLGFRPQVLLAPIFVMAVSLYAASMVDLLLVWRYAPAIAGAVRTLGAAGSIALLMVSLPATYSSQLANVSICLVAFAVTYAVGQVLAVGGGYRLILYRPVPIVVLGVFMMQCWLAFAPSTPGASTPLYAMVATAALSLLALFNSHSNPVLSGIGTFFARTSNLALVGGIGTFLLLYFTSIRGAIIASIPDQVILVEWGIVVLIAFILARRFLSYFRRRSELNGMAEWTRLVQQIGRNKGEVEYTSAIVRTFIDEGRKEPLLTHLALILGREGLDEGKVADAITPLVRYQEEEAPPFLRWAQGNRALSRKAQRTAVVRACMEISGLSPRAGTEVR